MRSKQLTLPVSIVIERGSKPPVLVTDKLTYMLLTGKLIVSLLRYLDLHEQIAVINACTRHLKLSLTCRIISIAHHLLPVDLMCRQSV